MRVRPGIARSTVAALLAVALGSAAPAPSSYDPAVAGADWPYYHGGPHGTHYSRLDQITAENVSRLKVAWVYDTGDAFGEGGSQSDMQSNPLIVRERLFTVSPKGRLVCLDAATGRERWTFDPAFGEPVVSRKRLRGVSYWSDGREERVLFTFGGHLLAVDAATGRLIESFGDRGKVDLREGLGRDFSSVFVAAVSPGAVYKDLIVMGSTGNTPGHVRAFDVRTGKLRWVFHTIPHPGEYGHETWPEDTWKTAKGANAWAGLTLDPERGLVFAPLASAGMGDKDFYGGDRLGDNLFGTSLVALDANTGRRVWHFQLVKHDLWDRDPPTPPTLITVRRNGRDVPAVAQPTKSGHVFVFHRETGEPLFPLQELRPPASDVPGEVSSPTQLVPVAPEPFARQRLTAENLTRRTPEAHAAVSKTLEGLRNRGPFDPPSLQGTVMLPGMDGGAEWGGAAWDPETGLLYVNANEMAWILKLRPQPARTGGERGEALYRNVCASCHGDDLKGSSSDIPDLTGVHTRQTDAQLARQIAQGGGRMPGFGDQLNAREIAAVVAYLKGDPAQRAEPAPEYPSTEADAFAFAGYTKFLDPDGYPAIAPPWGTLGALDVNTGRWVWRVPFGEYPELAAQGLKNTGSENYGGAVVTKGGVLFIGATVFDDRFRAFDKRTGRLLWEATLPAAGIATPSTYMAGGRQYVVIGAGGGKNPKKPAGGKIVAFALPE